MIVYELVEEKHNNDILGNYTSFGIKAADSFSYKTSIYIEDVFTDTETAKKYIALFNEEQLDLIHLEEVVDDILRLCQL